LYNGTLTADEQEPLPPVNYPKQNQLLSTSTSIYAASSRVGSRSRLGLVCQAREVGGAYCAGKEKIGKYMKEKDEYKGKIGKCKKKGFRVEIERIRTVLRI